MQGSDSSGFKTGDNQEDNGTDEDDSAKGWSTDSARATEGV